MSYLIVIPANSQADIHICGRCKTQFAILDEFLGHKLLGTCISTLDVTKQMPENSLRNRSSVPVAFLDNKASEPSVFITNENIKCVDGSLKDSVKNGIALEDQFNDREKLLADEEDVATLLASQFSKDDVDLAYEPESVANTDPSTSKKGYEMFSPGSKEEIVLYRGKMRNLFRCNADGCQYQSHMKKDIERHARVHTGERPFKCLMCVKTFTRADKLLLHQRIHNGDKRYKCSKCSYASVDSGSLIKHLRVHNGERPFRCMFCQYRSRDTSQLTVHLRSHTGDSPYVCSNEKCRSAFKTHSDLKRHLAIHSGVKPFFCSFCPYKSTFKGGLQTHIKNHHPSGEVVDYKCSSCHAVFPTDRKLKTHIQKAHSECEKNECDPADTPKYEKKRKKTKIKGDLAGNLDKNFNCTQCDASFVCFTSLQIHERFHKKMKKLNEFPREENYFSQSLLGDELIQSKESQRLKSDTVLSQSSEEKRLINDGILAENSYIDNISIDESERTSDLLGSFSQTSPVSRSFLMSSSMFSSELHGTQLGKHSYIKKYSLQISHICNRIKNFIAIKASCKKMKRRPLFVNYQLHVTLMKD